jgi:NADPH:quinone reductase-like Zn-dependent oxidoreductase
MKAAVIKRYGSPDVVKVLEVPKPTPAADQAVVCEGAFFANTVLEKIDLKPGHTILIYGASGAIGTALVQLAKCAGAAVTAVVATPHLELVKSLGADRAMWSSITRSNRVVMPAPRRVNGFLGFLKGRLETGQFRAIIDRTYDLAAIADAYRYVETGQKVGIVVINVAMGG